MQRQIEQHILHLRRKLTPRYIKVILTFVAAFLLFNGVCYLLTQYIILLTQTTTTTTEATTIPTTTTTTTSEATTKKSYGKIRNQEIFK